MSVSDDALVPLTIANVNFSPYSFLDTYCRHETDFTGLVVDCTFTIYVLTRDFLATRWRLLKKRRHKKRLSGTEVGKRRLLETLWRLLETLRRLLETIGDSD